MVVLMVHQEVDPAQGAQRTGHGVPEPRLPKRLMIQSPKVLQERLPRLRPDLVDFAHGERRIGTYRLGGNGDSEPEPEDCPESDPADPILGSPGSRGVSSHAAEDLCLNQRQVMGHLKWRPGTDLRSPAPGVGRHAPELLDEAPTPILELIDSPFQPFVIRFHS